MVQPGERLSLAPVGVGAVTDGGSERPRVESDGCAFFGEENVVQVGEDCTEPFHGAGLAFVDDFFAGFGGCGLGSFGAAFFGGAEGDREAGTAGFDLDLTEWAAALSQTGFADLAGAVGDDGEHEGILASDAKDVTYDVVMAHLPDGTPVLLTSEQIAAEVYATINREALRLGELLDHARLTMSWAKYEHWVDVELPFDIHQAQRMRAVWVASQTLPPEMLAHMPTPWRAIYIPKAS